MRWVLVLIVACGGNEPIPSAIPPAIPPAIPTTSLAVAAPKPVPCTTWRYALITAQFDPREDLPIADVIAAWRAGEITASADTIAALSPILGDATKVPHLTGRPDPEHVRAIVPAHELTPAWKAVAVDGVHPLLGGPLVAPRCGATAQHNIDPDRVTTLVMSGTTALTRRIAERIESHGVADTVRYVEPWFAAADLVHVSNEASFVRDCDPLEGPRPLTFCSREKYIGLLEAVHAKIIELTGSHLIDYGQNELVRTIKMYEKRGWVWFGGGRTQLEATEPRIVENHGNKLAFLGCNAVGTWLHAVSTGPGVAACDWPRMTWQIRDLRRRGYLPIVSIQHQETHVHQPPAGLVKDLRALAVAGAVFVLGSQAHSAHPWDFHHGAYVHYGPGNIFFQQYVEAQREATVDKLYFHAGTLLAVAHLYTRLEHGQPRLLTARERARFLGQLAAVEATLPPTEPWSDPMPMVIERTRPDSLVVQGGRVQELAVSIPEGGGRFPLVIDLTGGLASTTDAILVAPVGTLRATGPEIAGFMRAKYPVDPEHTTITPLPKHTRRR